MILWARKPADRDGEPVFTVSPVAVAVATALAVAAGCLQVLSLALLLQYTSWSSTNGLRVAGACVALGLCVALTVYASRTAKTLITNDPNARAATGTSPPQRRSPSLRRGTQGHGSPSTETPSTSVEHAHQGE